uniref:Uncharacterized protein n=1 Tax=Arundo donax TaxID=35708 RepID=A0A0A9H644_ARUDO
MDDDGRMDACPARTQPLRLASLHADKLNAAAAATCYPLRVHRFMPALPPAGRLFVDDSELQLTRPAGSEGRNQ